MNILALDTATECCSVAISTHDGVFARHALLPRKHAQHVLPMADELLAQAGLQRSQIDGIAVGQGPGAFTGVRLGVSIAQGLAFALACPVVTVSSLAALAMSAPVPTDEKTRTLAVMDARMHEVYAAVFTHTPDGLVQPVNEACVNSTDKLALPESDHWQVIGTGWQVYQSSLESVLSSSPIWAEGEHYPLAEHVLALAKPCFDQGRTLTPEQALPVYLRNKVAQTLAERGKVTPTATLDG